MTRQQQLRMEQRCDFGAWTPRGRLFPAQQQPQEETESSEGPYGSGRISQGQGQQQAGPHERVIDVLPLNSRVRVVGNKRTSASLVGKVGLVVKTACLGGWHKLKMETTGKSVKVQRNGLDVLEWGNGEKPQDVSDSDEFIDVQHGSGRLRSSGDSAWAQQQQHVGGAARRRVRKKGINGFERTKRVPEISRTEGGVDLSRLDDGTLWRYMRMYKQDLQPGEVSRGLLLWRTRDHFTGLKVDEAQVAAELCRKRARI